MPAASPQTSFGLQLRAWRQQRRRTQLELALDAKVSQRHLSFIESGRSKPSREMVLLLAEQLDIPIRERNALLQAAGFAPHYPERPLGDAALAAARGVVDTILRGHAPNPALAIDRYWHMIDANSAVAPLLSGVRDSSLLQPPVNVLRLSLHPHGLAPQIANLQEWRAHLLARLRHQVQSSADPKLGALLEDLTGMSEHAAQAGPPAGTVSFAVPLELDTSVGRLSLVTTTTVFGTPTEITLAELAIEAFYPANDATAARLRRLVPQ
jgi:transcriptional regulator with XRE-family HTH domain